MNDYTPLNQYTEESTPAEKLLINVTLFVVFIALPVAYGFVTMLGK